MLDTISAGPYIIRCKNTSTVLHVKDPDVRTDWSPVISHAQEENLYQDQQIWWIEPLPNSQDKEGKEEAIYSITNTPSGKVLGAHGTSVK